MEEVHEGRTACHYTQVDFGIDLLNYWFGFDLNDGKCPDYLRAGEFVPCDCNKCYFYINGHASGIVHAGKTGRPAHVMFKCNSRMKVKVEKCADVKEEKEVQ